MELLEACKSYPERTRFGKRTAAMVCVALALFGLSACAMGTPAEEPLEVPSEVVLAADEDGEYGPDELGLEGSWAADAGPDSSIEVEFDNGDLCMSGSTGTVLEGDFRTYWGARAVFNLCEQGDAGARTLDQCLDRTALDQFTGVAFTLEGDQLPWLVSVQFNEADRESPASVWLQSEGETIALFERSTDPFDSSAPAVDPGQLVAVTVRAVGDSEQEQAFDFCVRNFRALFGDEWADALVPDWLSEAGPGKQLPYVGANLVGAEFGEQNLPGIHGTDYIYPGPEQVDLYVDRGMNVFRLPFRWERMQRELHGELHEDELGHLEASVSAALARDATVILDPHNFARYEDDPTDDREPMLVGVDIEIEAFADFWSRLAHEFKDEQHVWFGLMNEPHSMETELWLEAANAALAAIRETGATNKVLVPGNQWTGAHAWFDSYYGTPNSEVMQNLIDPEQNFAFELHQYFDADSSGTSNACVSESIGVERVEQVSEWLRQHEFEGFLGEFGGSDDPICLAAMDHLLGHLGANSDVWLGWSV